VTGWATLADPIGCPGLFELLAVVAARTWREAPLGEVLITANVLLTAIALLTFAKIIHRATSSIVVSLATTLAAGAGLAMTGTLAPSPAATLLIAIGLHAAAGWNASKSFPRVVALSALLAATTPPLAIPAAVLAGWIGNRRSPLQGGLAFAIVLASSLLIQSALPPHQFCFFASLSTKTFWQGVSAFATVARGVGPLVLALAALGLLSVRRLPDPVRQSLAPLALASMWGVLAEPLQPSAPLTLLIFALWLLVANGLAEVWNSAGRSAGARVGVIALAVALVVLQVLGFSGRRVGPPVLDGHDRMSLAAMSDIVGALPRGAALVDEDAVSDLLTRALPSRMRTGDRFQFVRRDPAVIAEELGRTRVFALPRSQRLLQDVGIELAPVSSSVPGLAEIRQAHTCSPLASEPPTPLSGIAGRDRFSLVAQTDNDRGPIVIFLSSRAPLTPAASGWPAEALRGFHAQTFDTSAAPDLDALKAEMASYNFPAVAWSPDVPYVTRIEMWRTPGAPLALPVALGGSPDAGVARLTGPVSGKNLKLCPSFAYDIRPVATQRPR
jgi:hypothetical protein